MRSPPSGSTRSATASPSSTPPWSAQAGKVAHSTMLGNGNTVVVELAEALAPVVPVDDPHFLFAADGAVAVEQALKIAFQYWVNRGVAGPHARSSPSAMRTTATPSARSRSVTAACSVRCSSRSASRSCARRATPTRAGRTRRARRSRRTPAELAAVVHRAARAGCVGHVVRLRVRRAADRRGLPPGRHAPHLRRGGDRVRADRDVVRLRAVRRAARPHVRGQGDHRRVPGHVGHGGVGRGVRRVPRRRSRAGDLLPRAFLRGNALAAAVALEHLRLFEAWDVLGNVRARADAAVVTAGENGSPAGRRCARSASAASWSASSWRRPRRGCAGVVGCARARSPGACCCAPSATWWCSCPR